MAVTSGFFNSEDGDRMYDADAVNRFFDGFVTEGVLSSIGDAFNPTPGGGLSIVIGTGKAWYLRTWLYNSTPYSLSFDVPDASFSRYDAVVMEFDKLNRRNTIEVIKGTPSSDPAYPTLIDTDDWVQVPLCYVFIGLNLTELLAGGITSVIGTDTPFCTGLVQQADVTDLYYGWEAQFDNWLLGIEDDLAAIETGTIFNELNSIRALPRPKRNLLINGDFRHLELGDNPVSGFTGSPVYPGVASMWAFNMTNAGTWQLSKTSGPSYPGGAIRCEVTTARATLAADSRFMVSQYIENSRVLGNHAGHSTAQPMTLSFWYRSNFSSGRPVVEVYDLENDKHVGDNWDNDTQNVWQRCEFTMPAQTGDTHPNDNAPGYIVNIWVLAGSNYTGGSALTDVWTAVSQTRRGQSTGNMAATIGNYFEIADVQLEIGTSFVRYHRQGDDEVAAEVRRYIEFEEVYRTIGIATDANTIVIDTRPWKVIKRSDPTLSFSSGFAYDGAGYANFTGAPTIVEYLGNGFLDHDRRANAHIAFPTTETVVAGKAYPVLIADLTIDSRITSF